MIGLKKNTVVLLTHQEDWEENAKSTVSLIKSLLGDSCIDIQHVGSTSIHNIHAKPIIDIAVAVNDLSDINPYIEILEKHDIIFRKEEHTEQLLFIMGDLDNDIKTHHIHVVKHDSTNWDNYLNFRDYLNAYYDKAKQYDELKQELAVKFSDDRKAYTVGKKELIDKLLREAYEWRNNLTDGHV